jgi:hypothetical protein
MTGADDAAMRTRHALIGVTAAAALVGLLPAPAGAEERTCRGSLGSITVDNLRVPQGSTCTLTGTHVKGTIYVERDATLRARTVRVVGNVQAENAAQVNVVESSRIGGSVQVKQGGGASVLDSIVNGNVQYVSNRSLVRVNRNTVGGDVQAFQNTGGVGINSNRIDGNLQCKENVPAPKGSGNIVQGNKEDQCRRL